MRVCYHTFGCKANQYDTERMRQELEARGAAAVSGYAAAEVVVVNTCTVTNQADAEARRYIRRVHRENPGARIVVAGCSSAIDPDRYTIMPGVVAAVGGHDAVEVASASMPAAPVQIELRAPLDSIDTEPVGGELLRERRGASRGWLKVQDGCDRKCSFCATRIARGASRSRSPDDVVEEARLLARSHAEIVVTGIHIGHYGLDLCPEWTLSKLVARLLDDVPDVRVRIGSVEATEIDDLLVDLLSSSEGRLAPHLHMPLQSGADSVLRRMRRWHTREQYRSRALEIAERVAPLGLGADVITGFPGETEADHEATLALVDELPFTYLHVFPFSPRSGTAAPELDRPVPQRIAGERSRELRELARAKGAAYRARRIGQMAEVVLEGDGGSGLTGDYLRVAVPERAAGAPTRVAQPVAAGASHGPGRYPGTLRGDADHLYIAWPAHRTVIPA